MFKIILMLSSLFLLNVGFASDSLYTSTSGDTLTIHHDGTERNCAALFTWDVSLSGNLITATEVDTGDQAWCMCYFDLEVDLIGLEPGSYQIDIWSHDLGLDPVFHGSLELEWGGLAVIQQQESDCLAMRDDTSFVELTARSDTLNLFWNTPMLNCALEPLWSGWLYSDTFYVSMVDTGMPADCICPFEIEASFASFSPGTYTLDFGDGEYGYPQFTIAGLRDGPVITDSYQSPCYDPTSISTDELSPLPQSPWVGVTCFPNPFNNQVIISYQIIHAEDLEILIFDIKGNFIYTLKAIAPIESGHYETLWTGIDQQGQTLSSGIYLLVFRGKAATSVNRLILLN